jgi:predicted PurR-regulated permease PerM
MTLRDVFHLVALSMMVGWLLVIGKTVILPVVVAVMLTYVLIGAALAMQRIPKLERMPIWLSYVLVLTIFGLTLTVMSLVAIANLRDIAQTALVYPDDILALVGRWAGFFGIDFAPTAQTLRDLIIRKIDLPGLSLGLVSSLASAGGYTILIATYVVFMIAERAPLSLKIDLVLPNTSERGAAVTVFRRINDQIVAYLSSKTLINVIIGGLSYFLMLGMGIENAVFWAFVIGLLNYIPYVGSLLAVVIVVLYTLLATGSFRLSALALVVLTLAQLYVGNWLEPRVMSRSLNLSPLTVLVALVFWSSLWGLPGAIIAVPMTSILLIALGQFRATRAVAILASRDGNLY